MAARIAFDYTAQASTGLKSAWWSQSWGHHLACATEENPRSQQGVKSSRACRADIQQGGWTQLGRLRVRIMDNLIAQGSSVLSPSPFDTAEQLVQA